MARAEADSEGLLLLGEKPMLHERRREADVTRTAALGMAPHTQVNTHKENKQTTTTFRQTITHLCLHPYIHTYQSIYQSVYLFIYQSIYLSMFMHVCINVYQYH